MDFALNNLKRLIRHKTQKTNNQIAHWKNTAEHVINDVLTGFMEDFGVFQYRPLLADLANVDQTVINDSLPLQSEKKKSISMTQS